MREPINYRSEKQKKPEDPLNLYEEVEKIRRIDWDSKDRADRLNLLFGIISNLSRKEQLYYSRRRRICKYTALGMRILSWAFGTVGILLPLTAAASGVAISGWGYVLIAAAGALFSADNLFGLTTGHIRFVTVQLKIENIIVGAELKWQRIRGRATPEMTEELYNESFDLLQEYWNSIYDLTLGETHEWATALMKSLTEHLMALDKMTRTKTAAS